MSDPVAKHRPMIDLDEFERRLRRPAAPSQETSEDPLVELARLVAGEGNPYEHVLEQPTHAPAAAEPAWEDAPGEGAHDPHGTYLPDFSAIEAGLRGSMHADAPNADGADGASPPPGFHTARYPEDGAASVASATAPRSSKPLFMMAGVILLGIVGIGVSFAYKGRVAGPQQIATIMATPGPTKVQPSQQADGDAGAQRASVLDKSASQPAVALADHREEPVDVGQMKPPATPDAAAPPPVAVAPPVSAPPSMALSDQGGIAALIEPKKVKVVSVRPDGTVLPNDTPPRASVPAPAAPPPPAAAPPKPAAAKSSTPKTTANAVTPPKPAAPGQLAVDGAAPGAPAKPKPKPAPAKPTRVADATPEATTPSGAAGSNAGSFAVQLAAPGSEKEARETSSRLEHQFTAALDGHQPAIHRAKVGEKDVYRIRVGGLSREEAAAMCEKIKSSGGPKCFVARN